LFYGLVGAFVLRFASLFVISFLVDVWQVQAIGAIYLMFIAANHLIRKVLVKKGEAESQSEKSKSRKQTGFWMTVFKVELADLAFAVDSILAAVALAVSLPRTSLPSIGGMDGGQFLVVFLGGLIGLIIMRFAASFFVKLLHARPGLEVAAFVIVGWVGVKLTVATLSHPALSILSEEFAKSTAWKLTFYIMLVAIALIGWFLSKNKQATTGNRGLEEKRPASGNQALKSLNR